MASNITSQDARDHQEMCGRCAATKDKNECLLFAAEAGHVSCVHVLLMTGADVNTRGCNGETAVIVSVRKQNLDCAELLIQGGADVNILMGNGDSSLTLVALYGNTRCVTALLQAVTDVNVLNWYGHTALIYS